VTQVANHFNVVVSYAEQRKELDGDRHCPATNHQACPLSKSFLSGTGSMSDVFLVAIARTHPLLDKPSDPNLDLLLLHDSYLMLGVAA